MTENGIHSFLVVLCVLSSINPSPAQFDPSLWPEHEVVVSRRGQLKDIFDSGIRPYRFPSLEKTVLEFKHVRLRLRSGGKLLPEFPIDWATIKPVKGGLLRSLQLTTPDISVEKARDAMLLWIPFGDSSSVDTVDMFINALSSRSDFDQFPKELAGKARVVWTEPNGVRFSVFFKDSISRNTPLSLALNISWRENLKPLERRATYDVPIPPPPGYEGVLMKATGSIGPDSRVDILKSKGMPVSGGLETKEISPDVEKSPRKKNSFWNNGWLLFILSVAAFLLICRFRKAGQDSNTS